MSNSVAADHAFVITNFKQYLSDKVMAMFHKHIEHEKVSILLLESRDYPIQSPDEKKWILDKDLCIIEPSG